MKNPSIRTRPAPQRLPITRWLTVKFRESAVTRNEMFGLLRKFGSRISQLECTASADGFTWHIEVRCRSHRDLSRVVYALECLPGTGVAAYGDKVFREEPG